jgi:WD40 repeat protein
MKLDDESLNKVEICYESEVKFVDRIWSVSFNPKYELFACVGSDKKIHLVSFNKKSDIENRIYLEVSIETEHTRTIRSVQWDSSGELLGVGSFDGTASILFFPNLIDYISKDELKSKIYLHKTISILKGHESEVKSISFSCSSEYFATCSRDKTIWIWQCENLVNNKSFVDKNLMAYECSSILEDHSQDIKCIRFHPIFNDTLLSSSYDNTIKIWQISVSEEDWICVKTISNAHNNTVWCLSIDFNYPNLLVSCGEDAKISVINFSKHNDILNLEKESIQYNFKDSNIVGYLEKAHERSIYCVQSIDGIIISGGGDNTVNIFKAAEKLKNDRKIIELEKISFYNHKDDVNTVDIIKYENSKFYHIISGGDDNTVIYKLIKI